MTDPDDIRVLHVDDDPGFGDLVADALEREAGFDVVTETDAEAGLDRLDRDIDCVVSDYEMPGMDGLAFLEAVREEYPELPFVLFTGRGSEAVASEAISRGVTDYLQKGDREYGLLANRVRNAVARHRAERLSRRRAQTLEAIADHLPVALSTCDPDGRVVFQEGPALDAFDLVPGEHLDSSMFDSLEGEADLQQACRRALDGEVVESIYLAEGQVVETVHAPVRDATGEVAGATMVGLDVTEQVERHRDLQQSEELFRKVFEHANDAIFIVDLEGEEIRDCNPAACEMLDYERDELVGASAFQVHPEERDRFRAFAEMVREEGAGWTDELTCRTSDGRRLPAEISAARVDLDGTPHMVASARDISERKRRERELEQQNERLEQFASVVSHDLRNPLNVAAGNIDLAREEHDSDRLAAAADAIDRMDALVDDLLALARHGAASLDTAPVGLADTARSAWESAGADRATLDVTGDATVVADRPRLRQLLENLFRNAVEHAGPEVTVRVGPADGGFYVADDGPGIPAEERETVFEPGVSTREEGTGFGLAIVAEIAAAHDWTLSAGESEAGGARFDVTGVETA
ncbi:MAG: PAS domain S-box protein [Halobacteriaceae archaeon]